MGSHTNPVMALRHKWLEDAQAVEHRQEHDDL